MPLISSTYLIKKKVIKSLPRNFFTECTFLPFSSFSFSYKNTQLSSFFHPPTTLQINILSSHFTSQHPPLCSLSKNATKKIARLFVWDSITQRQYKNVCTECRCVYSRSRSSLSLFQRVVANRAHKGPGDFYPQQFALLARLFFPPRIRAIFRHREIKAQSRESESENWVEPFLFFVDVVVVVQIERKASRPEFPPALRTSYVLYARDAWRASPSVEVYVRCTCGWILRT